MTTATAARTGTIRISPPHRTGNMNHPVQCRRLAIILGRDWTQPPPICTYLTEHDGGLILLDSGESPQRGQGLVPLVEPVLPVRRRHPRRARRRDRARLRPRGIDPGKNLKTLVLSHLHHDHADGS